MGNKDLKFGVNCYGIKPKMNSDEKSWMDQAGLTPADEALAKEKAEENAWKEKIKNLFISPFNRKNWSRY